MKSGFETHEQIAKAIRIIEKERRTAMEDAMRDFDENYYIPNVKEIRDACDAIGHEWRFSHYGPMHDPWFMCDACRMMECRKDKY